MSRYLTVEDFLNAIEVNGFNRIRGSYFDKDKNPTSACAVGMGAWNLGIDPNDVWFPNCNKLMDMNDNDPESSFADIVKLFKNNWYPTKESLSTEITVFDKAGRSHKMEKATARKRMRVDLPL